MNTRTEERLGGFTHDEMVAALLTHSERTRAREIFCRVFRPLVLQVLNARRGPDRFDVFEEIANDTLMRALDQIKAYREKNFQSLKSWVLTIAIRQFDSYYTKQVRRKKYLGNIDTLLKDDENASTWHDVVSDGKRSHEDVFADRDMVAHVSASVFDAIDMSAMKPFRKEIMKRVYLCMAEDGIYSPKEIARNLGNISDNYAGVYKHDVLTLARESLDGL